MKNKNWMKIMVKVNQINKLRIKVLLIKMLISTNNNNTNKPSQI